MDRFLLFCLPVEDQAFLNQYLAPDTETAILKQVRLGDIDQVRSILRKIGIRTRTKYRGPRINTAGRHTLKRDARHASIYCKDHYVSKH
jgi:hypothetical protein